MEFSEDYRSDLKIARLRDRPLIQSVATPLSPSLRNPITTLLFAMNNGQTPDSDSTAAALQNSATTENSVSTAETPSESQAETRATDATTSTATAEKPAGSGPLASIIRGKGPLAARGLGTAKPMSPTPSAAKPTSPKPVQGKPSLPKPASPQAARPASPPSAKPASPPSEPVSGAPSADQATESAVEVTSGDAAPVSEQKQAPRDQKKKDTEAADAKMVKQDRTTKVAIPNLRQGLSDDLMAELERELAGADVDGFLGGNAGMANRKEPLEDGQRVSGKVLKIHDDSVFVALGGPDEGVVAFANFTAAEPKIGDSVEVIVRGINNADGLYVLTLPGEAVDVSEWEDIENGSIVEATITGSNSGGLECKVGGIRGFIPISQISEHRVEDTSEFVDQKMICVVTESNPRRGNLVLSRRAVLERERQEKKKEQLEKIEEGDLLEGVVRTIKDFGAFVDLGGLEGLIHISKLSWDRIKHPSEVLEVGQKVRVKIDKVDKQTGKMSLSYRDLLENPWDSFATNTAIGTVMKGAVTRTANFGAFVRLAAGVEGLVHISEVAGHRVSNVAAFVNEGQEVEVKILSIDRDSQKISLSMKQVHAKAAEASDTEVEEVEEPVREPVIKASHSGPLRGGNDRSVGGERFGLRW
jgi:ribosomal protein S1